MLITCTRALSFIQVFMVIGLNSTFISQVNNESAGLLLRKEDVLFIPLGSICSCYL